MDDTPIVYQAEHGSNDYGGEHHKGSVMEERGQE